MLLKEEDSTCDEPGVPLFCTLESCLPEALEIMPAQISDTVFLRGRNKIHSDTKAHKAFSNIKLDSQARNRWMENHKTFSPCPEGHLKPRSQFHKCIGVVKPQRL